MTKVLISISDELLDAIQNLRDLSDEQRRELVAAVDFGVAFDKNSRNVDAVAALFPDQNQTDVERICSEVACKIGMGNCWLTSNYLK